MAEEKIIELSKKERKNLEKQRKKAMKEAQKFHKEEDKKEKKAVKQAEKNTDKKAEKVTDLKVAEKKAHKPKTEEKEKTSDKQKKSHSKIEQKLKEKVKKQKTEQNLSKEERFIKQSEEKIQNLQPKAFDDGFYVDEYGEREKQKRVAKAIREKENEKVKRIKKPLTSKQINTRRIIISCITCAVVVAIGVTLSLTFLFKTEKIQVEGNTYYQNEEIIGLSNVVPQQNIFIATITATPEKIEEQLPFVEEARVEFVIPDTVKIKITDAIPSYIVNHAGKSLLVSSKGRILEEVTTNQYNLPQLNCNDIETAEVGKYIVFTDTNMPVILEQISQCINENEFDKITAIDITDTAKISIIYDNRIKIIIGLPEDIDYKIRTAMTIIEQKLDPNNLGIIGGTLDVSSCSTSKTSRFDPNATLPTVMQTTPSGVIDPSAATTATQGTTVDPRLPSNYVGFDTDGDGILECFDTDGDGYADVYGTLDVLFGTLPQETTTTASAQSATQGSNQTQTQPATQSPDTPNGYTGFDLDGDGVYDCYDTDGDGYADVYGSLEPDENEQVEDDNSSDSGQGIDPATGYTGFDLDGDGTYDCYDTDGDGYADLF